MELQLYLLVLAGMIVHLGLKLRDAWTKGEEFDIKKQLVFGLLGLPIALAVVYFRDYITGFIDVTPVTAFFLGYFLDSVIKNVESYGRKKVGG